MPWKLASICALLLYTSSPLIAAEPVTVSAAARSIQPGELVVLTITAPAEINALQVRAFGREFPAFSVDTRTWRALVGIDLLVEPGVYPAAIDGKSGAQTFRTKYELKVEPRRFPVRKLTVDDAFVNPPKATLDRIKREAAELQRLLKQTTPERLWAGAFVRPVPGAANSVFGTRSIFNGQPRDPHSGADLLSPAGTPIHAPAGGRIILARDLYFTGNTVLIDHGLGLLSLLAHMSVLKVHEGDTVTAGQIVGEVGATGRVTGPHLHWAVRVGGARVDPLSVLALVASDSH